MRHSSLHGTLFGIGPHLRTVEVSSQTKKVERFYKVHMRKIWVFNVRPQEV